jgi:hypothetical protein
MPGTLSYDSTPAPFRLWPFLRLAIIAWSFDALAVLSFPLQRWALPALATRGPAPPSDSAFQIALDQFWPYLAFLAIVLALIDALLWQFSRQHSTAPRYAKILRASLLISALLVSVFMPFRGYA